MKKLSWCLIIVLGLSCICLLIGCKSIWHSHKPKEEPEVNYYTKEHFCSIVIGKSTYQDVYEIAPTSVMCVTSYGGLCEYPMKTGGYICIKFYGKDLVVGDVEEILND